MDPGEYNHIFRTLFGAPPDKSDRPLCGADLSDSWDFPGHERPACPTCQELAGRITVADHGWAWSADWNMSREEA